MAMTTHVRKVKVKGHSVHKLESKQTDGRRDRADCITSGANAVGHYNGDLRSAISLQGVDTAEY